MFQRQSALLGLFVVCASLASGQACLADPARAELLSESCAACHGPNGHSAGSIPSIAGLEAADMIAAFQAFRSEARPATIMTRIARGFDDAEIAAIAAYFARLGSQTNGGAK